MYKCTNVQSLCMLYDAYMLNRLHGVWPSMIGGAKDVLQILARSFYIALIITT